MLIAYVCGHWGGYQDKHIWELVGGGGYWHGLWISGSGFEHVCHLIKGNKNPALLKYWNRHTCTCTYTNMHIQEARVVTESIVQFRSIRLNICLKLVPEKKRQILEFFLRAVNSLSPVVFLIRKQRIFPNLFVLTEWAFEFRLFMRNQANISVGSFFCLRIQIYVLSTR